ncbi:MAG: LysR family transcriptional regulator [Neisseriales bacterium]|nr:MAG: LysR family transcriptional regulator [Neisseriales bacterium]
MYDDLFLFARVARCNSLTQASRELNIYQSTLSRRISSLEKFLNLKLFARTSNQFELTYPGRKLYEQIKNDENLIQSHIMNALDSENVIFGELQIMLPQALSLVKVTPLIHKFVNKYPRLKLKIFYQNHEVNLKNGSFDLAVISGIPDQPSQKIKLIYGAKLAAFCTPAYIEKYGTPNMNNLNEHRFVVSLRDHGEIINRAILRDIKNGQIFEPQVDYQIACSNFFHNLKLVESDEFIGVTFLDILQESLDSKRYVTVLDDYEFEKINFYMLKRVENDPRINLCAEFIEKCFTGN